jgi:hypothetical protein
VIKAICDNSDFVIKAIASAHCMLAAMFERLTQQTQSQCLVTLGALSEQALSCAARTGFCDKSDSVAKACL